MPDSAPELALVLTEDGQPPHTLRRLSGGEALTKLLKALLKREDIELDQNLMDAASRLSQDTTIFEELGSPSWSGPSTGPLEAWLDSSQRSPLDLDSEQAAPNPDALNHSLDGVPILDAYFRRAEGLYISWDLQASSEHVVIQRLERAGGIGSSTQRGRPMTLGVDAYLLLTSLSSWSQVQELADSLQKEPRWIAAWLERFCRHGLAWFSETDCQRTLAGRVLNPLPKDQLLALSASCWPIPLIAGGAQEGPRPFPFMARGDQLAGARLAGFSFQSRRRGRVVQELKLHGDAQLGAALRLLVARLDGRSRADQLINSLPTSLQSSGGAALRALGSSGLLQALERPPKAWAEGHDDLATATWLGHASVLLRYGSSRVWIDPLLFPNQHQPRPQDDTPPDPRGLSDVSALLITHGDNDHLNPPTLSRIDPATPVILPVCDQAGPWQVDMRGILELLGFEDLRSLQPWEETRVGDAHITAIPFEGEDWGLDLCALTYRIEGQGQASDPGKGRARVYLGADSEGMARYGERIRGEQPIDLAFVGISGNTEAHVMTSSFGYGEFYRTWIPPERHARFTRLTDGPDQAAELAAALHSKRSFGYAAGAGSYIDTAYSDEGDHPAFARRLLELDCGCEPISLQIGVSTPIFRQEEQP